MFKRLRLLFQQPPSKEALSHKALNAAAAAEFEKAMEYIAQGGDPNYIGDALFVSGWGSRERLRKDNIAHILLRCHKTAAFVQLLQRGLDPDLSFEKSDNLLTMATSAGDAEAVSALLARGVDLSCVSEEKGALTIAQNTGRYKIAQMITAEFARREKEKQQIELSLQKPLKLPPPLKLKKKPAR